MKSSSLFWCKLGFDWTLLGLVNVCNWGQCITVCVISLVRVDHDLDMVFGLFEVFHLVLRGD